MGLFDFWKKRRRYNSWEDEESDDIELEVVDFGSLSANDRNTYIEEQCEIIVQCNNNVENAKREYKTIGSCFADIQTIESQDEKTRDRITYLARSIVDIGIDRKQIFSGEKKISGTRYMQLEQEEDNIVDGIKNLKNNEIYLQVVKKDMSALTGEKTALRMDEEELMDRQKIIKNISIVSMVCFVIIFGVLIVAGAVAENYNPSLFFWVLLGAALFVAADMLLYQRTTYNIMLTEKKLNRAISLHNKVKIKYINTKNLIDYQYEKYGVKSSYELSDLYQRYLETKSAREKYRQATLELNETEQELEAVLRSLGLYDPLIWMSQVKALADPKEMVEIRHNYSVRRQALRKYIEENTKRADDAKKDIKRIVREYKELATEVFDIVDKYDS